MTGYVLTWGNAHKTRSWYLLEVTFKKSNEHPVPGTTLVVSMLENGLILTLEVHVVPPPPLHFCLGTLLNWLYGHQQKVTFIQSCDSACLFQHSSNSSTLLNWLYGCQLKVTFIQSCDSACLFQHSSNSSLNRAYYKSIVLNTMMVMLCHLS